jgi:hypothetical protein
MQKVTGVASVRVSLNEGLTVLELKPGNTVTVIKLREIIRNNGFPTRDALIVAAGTAVATGNEFTFEVSGTGERFPVSLTPDLGARLKAGGLAIVTGTVDTRDPRAMKMTVSAIAAP